MPGCVDGWFALHERFGRLPMAEVLAPAIAYAREGFPVSELIAHYWAAERRRRWRDQPGFPETFTPRRPRPGQGRDLDATEALAAHAARRIGRGGRDAFYGGDMARSHRAHRAGRRRLPGYEDLAAHRGEWVEPVSTNYRGVDVWELPPNGQGIAALQILNILEGFDLAAMGFGSAEHVHPFVEAKKLAFDDRARFYADPAFAAVPVAELISQGVRRRARAR